MSKAAFDRVSASLRSQFPENDLQKYQSSISKSILRRFADYFYALPPIPDEDLEKQCRDVSQEVHDTHDALQALRDIPMGRNRLSIDTHITVAVETTLYKLKIEPPRIACEAKEIVDDLLVNLKTNLDVCPLF
jgi:hypothetical protein